MHHQGRVQSHHITPSAQRCTVSPNYMKLQSSEWFLPSGRQLDQQYLGHRGTEKAKQHCFVSVRINTAPPVPHPLHSKCHSKHVTDLPQKSSLSCCVGKEFLQNFFIVADRLSSRVIVQHVFILSEQSKKWSSPKEEAARVDIGPTFFSNHVKEESSQWDPMSFICACLHETKWEEITAG